MFVEGVIIAADAVLLRACLACLGESRLLGVLFDLVILVMTLFYLVSLFPPLWLELTL